MGARAVLATLAVALPGAALAAGNAHVVDDAEVETPGHCHVEFWGTRLSGNTGLFVLSPACTPAKLPNLEIGGFVSHNYPRRVNDFSAGPALKWELRSPDRRIGVAVAATVTFSSRTDRLEAASAIVPLTLDVLPWLRLNANLGYVWIHTGGVSSPFVGGQAEIHITKRLELMGETYYRTPGKVGVQSGVRWTPRDWLDIDLLGARRVDGSTPDAFTSGFTVRF